MAVQPHVTAGVGVPRAIYLRFPVGNQLGEAGKPKQQQTILTEALAAAARMEKPGTILELPYRWRRFPLEETPQFRDPSKKLQHPQAVAMWEGLDALVQLANNYKAQLQAQLARAESRPDPIWAEVNSLPRQIESLERLVQILDTDAQDQLRQIVNRLPVFDLMARGNYV